MLTRLSRNTALLLLNNLSLAGLALLLSLLIGRGLGEVALGQYAAVMAWILPLTLLADAGINTLLTRDLAQQPALLADYLPQAHFGRALIGGSLIGVVWIAAPWVSRDSVIIMGLRLTACMIWIDSTFGVYTAIWRAHQTMLPIAVLNIGLLSAQTLGATFVLWQGGGLTAIFGVIALADAAQLLATWVWWRWRYRPQQQAIAQNRRYSSELLRRAFPFGVAGVLAALQSRLIFLLLQTLNSPEALGWFAAASRFIEAAKMPAFAFFGAFFPALMSLSQHPALLRRTFWRAGLALVGYGVGVALLLVWIGPALVKGLYGDSFGPAGPIVALLGLSLPLVLLRQHTTAFYYAHHAESQVNHWLLAGLLLQGSAAWWLLRLFPDGRGAALALLVGEAALVLGLWQGRRVWAWPLLIGLLTIGLTYQTLAPLDFDGLYGQDSFAYYQYGLEMKEALTQWEWPGPMYWGLGFPSLLGGLFSFIPPTATHAQGFIVILGGLCAGLVYLWARDLLHLAGWQGHATHLGAGLAAGLFLGSGQLLQSSAVIMSDVPGLFWALLSAWAIGRGWQGGRGRWLALAAVALAMASITRWIYILLAIPWAVSLLYHWGGRIHWRPFIVAGLLGASIIVLQVVHSRQQPDALWGHQWLQEWSWEQVWQREFNNADGSYGYPDTIGQYYVRPLGDALYLPLLATPLLLLGLMVLARQPRRYALWICLVVGWYAVVFLFLIGLPYQNSRFALALFPPLCLLAGLGGLGLWQWARRWPMMGHLLAGIGLLALMISIYTTQQTGQKALQGLAQIKNDDLAAVEWAAATIPEADAEVYTLGLWLLTQHYAPHLTALQLYYETPDSLAQRNYDQIPTYLLLNMWNLEHQWQGKTPWIAFHWLESNPGLVHLGRHGNYHLFRVKGGEA
jgi:O-antigen/teichoic acid export membrane protein